MLYNYIKSSCLHLRLWVPTGLTPGVQSHLPKLTCTDLTFGPSVSSGCRTVSEAGITVHRSLQNKSEKCQLSTGSPTIRADTPLWLYNRRHFVRACHVNSRHGCADSQGPGTSYLSGSSSAMKFSTDTAVCFSWMAPVLRRLSMRSWAPWAKAEQTGWNQFLKTVLILNIPILSYITHAHI